MSVGIHLHAVGRRIEQRLQLSQVFGPHNEKPPLSMGVVLQLLRAVENSVVAFNNLSIQRRIHVLNRLDGLNGTEAAALAEISTHLWQVDENDVTKLIDGERADSNPYQFAISIGVLVAVSEAKRGGKLKRHLLAD